MTEHRVEKDSMGEIKVPQDALYGAQTQRAISNFTISTEPMPWLLIESLLQLKYCAARANQELGLLTQKHGDLICNAVKQLLSERPKDQFPVPVYQTGSGTSTNMNVNEVIAGLIKKAGTSLSPNDHVNLGQSSNDVIPSTIHVATAISITDILIPSLGRLSSDIRDLAQENMEIVKTGRTHLMDALPIRLADELEAWAQQVDECIDRFAGGLTRLTSLPLGGTAVGSGVNCHPQFSQRVFHHLKIRTGITFKKNSSSFKGQSSLDTLVELSGHLKTGAIVTSKIANDLRWMNSGPLAGLNEIQLPPLQPGSSIMPAKINPVIPEAVLMAMAQVIGNDATLNIAGLGGSFQLNTMLPIAGAKLIESLHLISSSCLALGEKCIRGLTILTGKMEQSLSLNPILVTSLNPLIGYSKAAEIAKIAMREKRAVLEVAKEHTDITEEELKRLLNPSLLADGGKTPT